MLVNVTLVNISFFDVALVNVVLVTIALYNVEVVNIALHNVALVNVALVNYGCQTPLRLIFNGKLTGALQLCNSMHLKVKIKRSTLLKQET